MDEKFYESDYYRILLQNYFSEKGIHSKDVNNIVKILFDLIPDFLKEGEADIYKAVYKNALIFFD